MRPGTELRWRHVIQNAVWGGCLLVSLASFTPAGHAQFSGPALGAPTVAYPPASPTTDPAVLYPSNRDVVIVQGDLLTIRLFEQTDYEAAVRIGVDGTVQLPLIGPVTLTGLTVGQAEDLIARKLVDAGMYRDPQVLIGLTETPNQFVTITGEIHAVIPVNGPRRLYDILASAGGGGGGFTGGAAAYGVVSGGGNASATLPQSASHVVTILRPSVPKPIVVDLGTNPEESAKANIPILPGDTIVISRVGVVYVVGAFKTQGAIPLVQNSPLTLMQVAALSGGIGFEARHDDLRIVRTVGLERKVIKVDIAKVLNGKAPDPVLQADDILFLPSNPLKAAIKSGGLGTVLGALSILVYAVQQ